MRFPSNRTIKGLALGAGIGMGAYMFDSRYRHYQTSTGGYAMSALGGAMALRSLAGANRMKKLGYAGIGAGVGYLATQNMGGALMGGMLGVGVGSLAMPSINRTKQLRFPLDGKDRTNRFISTASRNMVDASANIPPMIGPRTIANSLELGPNSGTLVDDLPALKLVGRKYTGVGPIGPMMRANRRRFGG